MIAWTHARPTFLTRLVPSEFGGGAVDLAAFARHTQTEWIDGSAIDPALFAANVAVVADEAIAVGGEVSYPLHEALNWQVCRWRVSLTGKMQRPAQHGAIIYTQDPIAGDRDVFQVKLEYPLLDRIKGKPRKYENPVGRGQVGGFATVPPSIWQRVAARARCTIASPQPTHFWEWVRSHPEIPIIICEGMKKACALLSQGYAAIALSGITMGRCNDGKGHLSLQPYLQIFATAGRAVYLCFDAETKPQTAFAVHQSQMAIGKLLEASGCTVRIVRLPLLPGTDKTGVDDFLVARGPGAFAALYQEAPALDSDRWLHRYQRQLTYTPSLVVNTPDLAQADLTIPQEGIIAFHAAKGTGKSKAIAQSVTSSSKLALLGHRISLMRNLCQRLGVDFKGDIDRANGQFIAGAAYTLRVGACVDSLLAFDPRQFAGCDLVIDEVEQVLRHLIAGDTCNKDGKRPALIARLHLLVRTARRIIVADADLSDLSLNYLRALRGPDSIAANAVFLIRNEYQPPGYPVRFLQSSSDAAIASALLSDLARGDKILVATDSKANSKAIAKLIAQMQTVRPNLRVLLINSETSGGVVESDFLRQINERVRDYDVAIATPSMSTGISIETPWFDKVYGMFYGTIGDADICQALSRVRAPVPRVVWCVERGNNFCRIDRSEFPTRIANTLRNRWDREASLIRASLGTELQPVVNAISWDTPHLDLWCNTAAVNNASMWALRANLIERLRHEGNTVEIIEIGNTDNEIGNAIGNEIGNLLKDARQQVKQARCQAIAGATILSDAARRALAQKEARSPSELLDEQKTAIARFYGVDEVTPELVEFDNDGKRRSQLLRLEALFFDRRARESDLEALHKQARFREGIFIPDQPCHELQRFVRDKLGLLSFLVPDVLYTDETLERIGTICRACAADIKRYLGFHVPPDATNIWIFRQLCHQLGITTRSKRRRQPNGTLFNTCWLDPDSWTKMLAILTRRQELVSNPIAPCFITTTSEGAIEDGSPPLFPQSHILQQVGQRMLQVATALQHRLPRFPLSSIHAVMTCCFYNNATARGPDT